MGIQVQPPGFAGPAAPSPSLSAYGLVTGPAAALTICQISSPPPGTYQVTTYFGLSGIIAQVDFDNARMTIDGVNANTIPAAFDNTAGSAAVPCTTIVTTNGTSIRAAVKATATATALYSVLIVANRIA